MKCVLWLWMEKLECEHENENKSEESESDEREREFMNAGKREMNPRSSEFIKLENSLRWSTVECTLFATLHHSAWFGNDIRFS